MRIAKAIVNLIVDAAIAWNQDKASLYAASIAYYMTFSIAPLLVLSVAIASRVFTQAVIEGQLVSQIDMFIGSDAAIMLENILRSASIGSSRFTIISILFLFWAASGVFNHLKRALDIIYGVTRRPTEPQRGCLFALRNRFFAFAMVVFMGVLLLAAITLNTLVTAMDSFLVQYLPGLTELNATVTRFISPAIMFFLFGIIFKTLPEARIAWRDVWLGAGVTTSLFLLGNYFIAIYLQFTSVASVYGAAGSLIIILVWIYYSAQIVMYGAEFTKLYAIRYGGGIVPRNGAISLAEYYSIHAANRPELVEEDMQQLASLLSGTNSTDDPPKPTIMDNQ
ncbi:MAG: YihY/virulence factor BrkB family protein [Candidatus Promineifilaceae bacterium]